MLILEHYFVMLLLLQGNGDHNFLISTGLEEQN